MIQQMVNALIILGGIIFSILLLMLIGGLMFTVNYIWMYRCHKCPHCGHFMNFKGIREDNNGGHLLFHCPKCGAWHQPTRKEFFGEEGEDGKA